MYGPSQAPTSAPTDGELNVQPTQPKIHKKPETQKFFGREYTASEVNTLRGAFIDVFDVVSGTDPKTTATKDGLAINAPPAANVTTGPPPPPSGPSATYEPGIPLKISGIDPLTTSAPEGTEFKGIRPEIIIFILLILIVVLVIFEIRMRSRMSHMVYMIFAMERNMRRPQYDTQYYQPQGMYGQYY